MTDIVERLRKICEPITVTGDPDTVSACQDMHELISAHVREAADEIERLRTGLRGAATVVRASADEIEKLRAKVRFWQDLRTKGQGADEIEKLRAQVVSLQSSLDAGPPSPGKKTPDAPEKPE
jgi:alcohol dehydrogenase class IV